MPVNRPKPRFKCKTQLDLGLVLVLLSFYPFLSTGPKTYIKSQLYTEYNGMMTLQSLVISNTSLPVISIVLFPIFVHGGISLTMHEGPCGTRSIVSSVKLKNL